MIKLRPSSKKTIDQIFNPEEQLKNLSMEDSTQIAQKNMTDSQGMINPWNTKLALSKQNLGVANKRVRKLSLRVSHKQEEDFIEFNKTLPLNYINSKALKQNENNISFRANTNKKQSFSLFSTYKQKNMERQAMKKIDKRKILLSILNLNKAENVDTNLFDLAKQLVNLSVYPMQDKRSNGEQYRKYERFSSYLKKRTRLPRVCELN